MLRRLVEGRACTANHSLVAIDQPARSGLDTKLLAMIDGRLAHRLVAFRVIEQIRQAGEKEIAAFDYETVDAMFDPPL